jgi:hypothetical protein
MFFRALLNVRPAHIEALDRRPFAPVVDQVEVCELNHFYDENGKLVFEQLIFLDWCPRECRYQVRDWRLLKSAEKAPSLAPNGLWTTTWHDGGVLRQVRAHAFRESWTQWDVELVERSVLPKEMRRELTDPTPRVERSVLVNPQP